MSIQTSFALDIEKFRKELEDLGARGPAMLARALNRGAVSGQTAMVKVLHKDMGISAKAVKREVRIDKATRTSPVVALTIKGARIPLIDMGARGPEPSRGRGRGVSYVGEGGARKRIAKAFIGKMPSGHRGVFGRKTKRRLPIIELRGPSLPHVFEKQLPVFAEAAQESVLKNLANDISFAKSKASTD